MAMSVLSLPGTDLSLIESVKAVLKTSSRPLRVATGKQMFTDGWEMV